MNRFSSVSIRFLQLLNDDDCGGGGWRPGELLLPSPLLSSHSLYPHSFAMNESPTSTLDDSQQNQPSVTFDLPATNSPQSEPILVQEPDGESAHVSISESPTSGSPEGSPSLFPQELGMNNKSRLNHRPSLNSRLSSDQIPSNSNNVSRSNSSTLSQFALSPTNSPSNTLDSTYTSNPNSPPTLQSPTPRRSYALANSAHSRSVSNASVGSNLSVPGMLSPIMSPVDSEITNKETTVGAGESSSSSSTTQSQSFNPPQRQSTSSPSRNSTSSPSTPVRRRQGHSRASSTHSLHSRSNSEYSEYKETLDAKSKDLEDGSRIINQYKMLNVIGQGAYGTVHRAVLVHGGEDGPEFVSRREEG